MNLLRVLRFSMFRRVWAGQLVNMIGDAMFAVVIALFLAGRDDSAQAIGVVLACVATGGIVSLLVGGTVVDRFRRSRVIIVSDLIRVGAVLAILAAGSEAPLLVLALLSMWMGVGGGIYRPAYGALLPSLVPAEHVRPANAVRSMSNRFAAIVGSALGGVAVAAGGVEFALLANIGTFAVSIVTLFRVEDDCPARTHTDQSIFAEAVAGARYVREHHWQLAIMLQGAAQVAFVIGPLAVLIPLLYADSGNGPLVGFIVAAEAAGAFIGAAWGGSLQTRRPGLVGLLALSSQMPQIAAIAVVAPSWIVVPASVVAGIGLSVFGVLWVTALQTRTPPDLLGRVLSTDALANSALSPVGLLIAGPAVPLLGPQPVAWAAAAVLLASIVAVLPVQGVIDLADPLDSKQALRRAAREYK